MNLQWYGTSLSVFYKYIFVQLYLKLSERCFQNIRQKRPNCNNLKEYLCSFFPSKISKHSHKRLYFSTTINVFIFISFPFAVRFHKSNYMIFFWPSVGHVDFISSEILYAFMFVRIDLYNLQNISITLNELTLSARSNL